MSQHMMSILTVVALYGIGCIFLLAVLLTLAASVRSHRVRTTAHLKVTETKDVIAKSEK